jgi:8-oxo-dGTP pyrophosphatase MutT (NUDIX family)
MTNLPPYKTTSSEVISDTKLFRLEVHQRTEDTTGRTGTFFVLDAPDWINVVAITTEGKFILVEQFRHGTERNEVEIVGGLVDRGENPQEAALRELREETGYVPSASSRIELIGTVHPNPAFLTNRCHTYLMTDCTKEHEQSLDEHERIHVSEVTEDEFVGMIKSGTIDHSLVLNAYLWYQLAKP